LNILTSEGADIPGVSNQDTHFIIALSRLTQRRPENIESYIQILTTNSIDNIGVNMSPAAISHWLFVHTRRRSCLLPSVLLKPRPDENNILVSMCVGVQSRQCTQEREDLKSMYDNMIDGCRFGRALLKVLQDLTKLESRARPVQKHSH
jgi:hypothetical protein